MSEFNIYSILVSDFEHATITHSREASHINYGHIVDCNPKGSLIPKFLI